MFSNHNLFWPLQQGLTLPVEDRCAASSLYCPASMTTLLAEPFGFHRQQQQLYRQPELLTTDNRIGSHWKSPLSSPASYEAASAHFQHLFQRHLHEQELLNANRAKQQRKLEALAIPTKEDAKAGRFRQQKMTKFMIEEILKPEFGAAVKGEAGCGSVIPSSSPSKTSCSGWNNHKRAGVLLGTSPAASYDPATAFAVQMGRSAPCERVDRRGGEGEDIDMKLTTSDDTRSLTQHETVWPAWVYCTRYSDRPSSGPRTRRVRRTERYEKRPRTAFTTEQLRLLKKQFDENHYLTEERRLRLARELKLNESQIKIWFQNRRAKIKKSSGNRNGLALELMAHGLYDHSTSVKSIKEETTDPDDVTSGPDRYSSASSTSSPATSPPVSVESSMAVSSSDDSSPPRTVPAPSSSFDSACNNATFSKGVEEGIEQTADV